MRRTEIWFEITYKQDGVFKTQHHLAQDKDRAEQWGEKRFGKIYGVQKVNLDDLVKSKEEKYEQIVARQQPLGLKIAKNVYEVDFDLTEMLVGKPKRKVVENKVERKSKWDLLAEHE